MAKSRPMDPAPRRRRDRPAVRINRGAATKSEWDEDAWAQGGSHVPRTSVATCSQLSRTPVKQDEAEDDIALETPIALGCWKVIAPDGREEVTYKPIPGFEHLWNGTEQAQVAPSPPPAPLPRCQTPAPTVQAPAPAPALSTAPERRKRKRTRAIVQDSSEDDIDDHYGPRDVTISTHTAYHFHIGDLDALKKFFRRRLDELTTKPVRPIVTAWLKLLEPKRLSIYGRYHKKLPREQPPACTPPWWPHDVPYEEPSHLDKTCLLALAVDIMLQHRPIDEVKRKGSWVAKLRHTAEYAVQTTPSDQFSSSKGSGFSNMMQIRALTEILPSLFDIAQKYEDHVCQSQQCGNTNLGMGGRVTWQPLTRPPRQTLAPRKRHQTAKATSVVRVESDADASGDDTDVDDTVAASHLSHDQNIHISHHSDASASRQGAAVSVRTQEPPQPDIRTYSTTATPNTSFGSSMHALHLTDNMDLNVNGASSVSYNSQPHAQHTLASTPMQYSSVHPSYNSQLHQSGTSFPSIQSVFAPVSPPAYEHSLHMFDVPYPLQAASTSFNSHTGYPYDYDYVTTSPALSLFNGLPFESNMSCHQQTSRH
ncbi:DUF2841 domain-containing protein [Pyrenophora tritici-repentis]|uniref:DUF2841 containing protein n=1 Tax=Pyrenophora tritici-repentis TaxID=45151 RepID=A0A2W1HSD4_9PLEO|nr:DUF2841 domain-containing protein [Pyrenophora tritici-repentis]KAI0610248.1 DUF2841 domain-containing protein [Pyrenophora tritici-repentis]KAI0622190.1 DUF2841 domain-containing protein [Pyrenophora tritici-repentis]KAI1520951.1 DUF2841 containing protein [Pyrenophora tritici-repentis]KAI1674699.1 DUF2841 containing protein [Pyrenophora tritici-repentis]